jgi:hypothetical protein
MAVSACFVGHFQDQNPGFVKASLSRLFAAKFTFFVLISNSGRNNPVLHALGPYISWTNGPGKGVRLPLLRICWQVMNQDLAGGKYHRKKGKADCGNVPVTQDI